MTTDTLVRVAIALERIAEALERGAPDASDPAAKLLPLVHEFAAGRVFNGAELVAHGTLPDNAALRVAIARCVGLERPAQKLGRLLQRCCDKPIAGYVVRRVKRDRSGILWTVAQV